MSDVLRLSAVSKSYGATKALSDISFALSEGEFAGLLGPNGAGKTTLFQIVAGLFAPDAGEVRVFGRTHRDAGAAIRARLGVVFQARSVDADMTVAANLRFHGRLFGLSGDDLGRRIAALAGRIGLSDHLRRPVRTLSGGQQRRVEIARALIARPRLLLMDEATAGLDPPSRADLVDHVSALAREEAVTVLWATHLVEELAAADRVIVLDRGRLRADGSPAAIRAATGAADLAAASAALTGRRAS